MKGTSLYLIISSSNIYIYIYILTKMACLALPYLGVVNTFACLAYIQLRKETGYKFV